MDRTSFMRALEWFYQQFTHLYLPSKTGLRFITAASRDLEQQITLHDGSISIEITHFRKDGFFPVRFSKNDKDEFGSLVDIFSTNQANFNWYMSYLEEK